MEQSSSFEESQQDLNPHRREEQRHAAETIAGWLSDRNVELDGGESPDQVVELWSAVERFERRVRDLGGDSMVNTLRSSQPDAAAFVLPRRAADEHVDDYTARVLRATELLTTAGPIGGETSGVEEGT